MSNQRTTNHSERDIDKQFKLAEFNRIFEQNNLKYIISFLNYL